MHSAGALYMYVNMYVCMYSMYVFKTLSLCIYVCMQISGQKVCMLDIQGCELDIVPMC